jgi:hypothetical protein
MPPKNACDNQSARRAWHRGAIIQGTSRCRYRCACVGSGRSSTTGRNRQPGVSCSRRDVVHETFRVSSHGVISLSKRRGGAASARCWWAPQTAASILSRSIQSVDFAWIRFATTTSGNTASRTMKIAFERALTIDTLPELSDDQPRRVVSRWFVPKEWRQRPGAEPRATLSSAESVREHPHCLARFAAPSRRYGAH